ncbi:hypothetical protein ACFL29_00455 [Patescibacteria group bacterium]
MSDSLTLKLDKRLLFNILLFIAVLAAILIIVELGIIAYALKAGVFCESATPTALPTGLPTGLQVEPQL